MMSSSSTIDKAKILYADLILDPAFPGQEPVSEDRRNTMLGRRFGIPIPTEEDHSKEQKWLIRPMSNYELLQMYSIPPAKLNLCTEHDMLTHALDEGLPFSLPWNLREQTINHLLTELGILDTFVQSSSIHCDTIQCYFTKQTPETLDWKTAYANDTNTHVMKHGLLHHKTN